VRGWIANPKQREQFETDWNTKIHVVCAVGSQLDLDDTSGWQALGVVFGDALSMVTGYPWAELTDEYGTAPCLVINAAAEAALFPLTMLSKRAEGGECPDTDVIADLFQHAIDHGRQVENLLASES